MVKAVEKPLYLKSVSTEDLASLARQILEISGENRIILFYGDLGSGKTTIIQELCLILEVEDTVTSPTFTIINEYRSTDGELIYHFDFYRVKNIQEAQRIGVEEYFDSGGFCFIEWPLLIEPMLPDKFVAVSIDIHSDESRSITIEKHG